MEHKIMFFKPLILLCKVSNWIRVVCVEMTIQTFLFNAYLSSMV